VFLCAATATGTGLKIVVREAIGDYLYVSLIRSEAELAHVVIETARVVVINALDLFRGVAQEYALPPFLGTGLYFIYWIVILARAVILLRDLVVVVRLWVRAAWRGRGLVILARAVILLRALVVVVRLWVRAALYGGVRRIFHHDCGANSIRCLCPCPTSSL
jgi:hypothetical protein